MKKARVMDAEYDVPAEPRMVLKVVAPELADQMSDFRMRISALNAGYATLTDWHPVIPDGWGQFPAVDFQRSVVYRAAEEGRAYNHHQVIAKFKNRYIVCWASGLRHEDYAGPPATSMPTCLRR